MNREAIKAVRKSQNHITLHLDYEGALKLQHAINIALIATPTPPHDARYIDLEHIHKALSEVL